MVRSDILTDVQVKNAKPRERPYKLTDGRYVPPGAALGLAPVALQIPVWRQRKAARVRDILRSNAWPGAQGSQGSPGSIGRWYRPCG